MMNVVKNSHVLLVFLISFILFSFAQETQKPSFPDVFQVEVRGIFKDENTEMEGSLYYDKRNNRAAYSITFRGSTKKEIFRFFYNEMLSITGTECTTREISAEDFFPFTVGGTKLLGEPEKLFYFTNSTLDRSVLVLFPANVYKGKVDIPRYGLKNCDVMHVFTRPEEISPDCGSDTCQSKLVTISVKCSTPDGKEIDHTYNFFKFRPYIVDENAFLPHSGVFCNISNKNLFPGLPAYFSFSYDLIDEQKGTGDDPGVFIIHKKVWYDSKLNIFRMDEFDDDGILKQTTIIDYYSEVAYVIVASFSVCDKAKTRLLMSMDEITRLPKVLFQGKEALTEAIYVGTRSIHAMDYEVWSHISNDEQNESKIVQDFYFTKNSKYPRDLKKMKLSHVEIYTYQSDELKLFTYLSINSLISRLRWEAFDVSPCYTNEQKKGFRLKVEGPPTVKDSKTYQDILHRLYLKLIIATNVSVVRFSEVACVYDGLKIVEFTGWILDKPTDISVSEMTGKEPDMNTAYRIMEDAAKAGDLNIKIRKDGKEVQYNITAIEKIEHPESIVKNLFSGATVAGVALGLFAVGLILGVTSYHVFIRKRQPPAEYSMHITSMKG